MHRTVLDTYGPSPGFDEKSPRQLKFERDEMKNRANRKKYGISFMEARSAFLDEGSVRPAGAHRSKEIRMPKFITIGYGDREGYDRTPKPLRDKAHAQDD